MNTLSNSTIDSALDRLDGAIELMRHTDPPPSAPVLVQEWVEQAAEALRSLPQPRRQRRERDPFDVYSVYTSDIIYDLTEAPHLLDPKFAAFAARLEHKAGKPIPLGLLDDAWQRSQRHGDWLEFRRDTLGLLDMRTLMEIAPIRRDRRLRVGLMRTDLHRSR